MKIALIITGQIRTVNLTKWFHKSQFVDNENCDIFLSINPNNSAQTLNLNSTKSSTCDEIEDLIQFYKPKNYFVGSELDDEQIYNDYKSLVNSHINFYDLSNTENVDEATINEYLIGQKETYMKKLINLKNITYNSGSVQNGLLSENSIKGIFFQFYFVKKGYELVQKYKEKTNTKYDIVIRIRFDHILLSDNFMKFLYPQFEVHNNTLLFNENNIKLSQQLLTYDVLHYDSIQENTINVMGAGVYKKYVYVNDFFWTHGDDLINNMLLFYSDLPSIIAYSKDIFFPIHGASIEHFFAIFLFTKKINVMQSTMTRCNIIRQI